MNQQTIDGNWNELKGKLTEKWGQLSDNDFKEVKGNAEQLIGMIQRKTGEAREAVSDYVQSLLDENGPLGASVERAQRYANAAYDTAQETAQQAAERVRAGYEQTTELVRRHPSESLAICFGVGILAGLVTGLALRSR